MQAPRITIGAGAIKPLAWLGLLLAVVAGPAAQAGTPVPPVAVDDFYVAVEETPLAIAKQTGVLANDSGKGKLIAVLETGPANGRS